MTDFDPGLGSPAQFSLKVTRGNAHEFELWQASVAPMFEIAPVSTDARAAFAMETLGYFLPGMAISKTTSSGDSFVRSRSLIAKSGIEDILTMLCLEGSPILDVEGVQSGIAPGDIAVFDLTREMTIHFPDYKSISITMRRDMLTPMIVDMEKLHGIVLKAGAPRNVLLKSHIQALHAAANGIGVSEQSSVAQVTAALLASCVGPSLAAIETPATSVSVTTLQLIRHAIDRQLSDLNMGPESLARQFGLSRASMYRLFEPLGGVRAYIRQRRLMHAYQLITSPSHFNEPIGMIARRLGFKRDAAFSRAFRALYNVTPSDVRMAARSGYASKHEPQSGDSSFRRVNRWLLGFDANGGTDG